MAPPHVSRKSITATESTTRKGHRELRKHVVEQIEEAEDDGFGDSDVEAMDVDREAELPDSQSTPGQSDGKLEQLMVDMVDAVCVSLHGIITLQT